MFNLPWFYFYPMGKHCYYRCEKIQRITTRTGVCFWTAGIPNKRSEVRDCKSVYRSISNVRKSEMCEGRFAASRMIAARSEASRVSGSAINVVFFSKHASLTGQRIHARVQNCFGCTTGWKDYHRREKLKRLDLCVQWFKHARTKSWDYQAGEVNRLKRVQSLWA